VAVLGNRVTSDAGGWQSIPSVHKPYKSRSELAGPTVVTAADVGATRDRDVYYSSVGRQNATAFNRHAFGGRGGTRSQLF